MSERFAVRAPNPATQTSWLGHVKRWSKCQACPLGALANNHVFGRGDLKCDYVLIGEGPGRAENALGFPFIGRSGMLLDDALRQADAKTGFMEQGPWSDDGRIVEARKFFFMNLVACRPTQKLGAANRAPNPGEVRSCSSRFAETLSHTTPSRGILLLGRVPDEFYPSLTKQLPVRLQGIPVHRLPHPSAVLRTGSPERFAEYVRDFEFIFQKEQRR